MHGTRDSKQRPQRRRPTDERNNRGWRLRQNGSGSNAPRNYERYVALAREATSRGDSIEAENYYQHAEHYFRVMRERAS
jgi:uncharacterized protein DUF4167